MSPRFPTAIPAAWRAVLVCGLVSLAVAACGRKGPLEPPPSAATPTSDPMANRQDAEGDSTPQQSDIQTGGSAGTPNVLPTVSPLGGGRKGKPIVAPKKPFVLDPIL